MDIHLVHMRWLIMDYYNPNALIGSSLLRD